jgi:hypothetical protein
MTTRAAPNLAAPGAADDCRHRRRRKLYARAATGEEALAPALVSIADITTRGQSPFWAPTPAICIAGRTSHVCRDWSPSP